MKVINDHTPIPEIDHDVEKVRALQSIVGEIRGLTFPPAILDVDPIVTELQRMNKLLTALVEAMKPKEDDWTFMIHRDNDRRMKTVTAKRTS